MESQAVRLWLARVDTKSALGFQDLFTEVLMCRQGVLRCLMVGFIDLIEPVTATLSVFFAGLPILARG